MPIINNIKSSFTNRRSRLTDSIGSDIANNIVNKAVEQTKVNVLQVKPNGYNMVSKVKEQKEKKETALDIGLKSKKNKLMF